MASVIRFETVKNQYIAGEIARIAAVFDEAVFVNLSSGGQPPVLSLSNGATATFVSNNSDTLYFDYLVTESDNATPSVSVTAFAENDAQIFTSANAAADTTLLFTGASANNALYVAGETNASVAIDTQVITQDDLTAPRVSAVTAVSGNYQVDQQVTLKVSFNEVVVVNANGGVPELLLSANGESLPFKASYVAGSGTKTLSFRFTVPADTAIADLEVGNISLNGGVISDFAGNNASLLVPALPSTVTLSLGDITTTTTTEPGTTVVSGPVSIDTIRYNGDDATAFKVGEVIELRVNFDSAVSVDTSAGKPRLVLNNGGFAEYVGGSESNSLIFNYTVSASDRNTQDLGVLGVLRTMR